MFEKCAPLGAEKRPDPKASLCLVVEAPAPSVETASSAGDGRESEVGRARLGDADAFDALVMRHRPRTYRLALRMLKDSRDAEEATQETFLSAWTHLPKFRGESLFGSWLHRICSNFCLMKLRSKKLEREFELEGTQASGSFAAVGTPSRPDPDEHILLREMIFGVERAIADLALSHRSVLVLKVAEGRSSREIAARTGMTSSAVRSCLHSARVALRDALAERYRVRGLTQATA